MKAQLTMNFCISMIVIATLSACPEKWTVNGVATEPPSREFLTFLTVFNGDFRNAQQAEDDIRQGTPLHTSHRLHFVPVEIPSLKSGAAFFFEKTVQGELDLLQLLVVSEGSDGIFNVKPYNLTVPENYRPGTYDMNNLKTLNVEDLTYKEECLITYSPAAPATYFAIWPDCQHDVNGNPSPYTALVNCEGIFAEVPKGTKELQQSTPYYLLVTERYPLLPYMYGGVTDFENPCQAEPAVE